MYFARTWDKAYRPVLEMHDPGEGPAGQEACSWRPSAAGLTWPHGAQLFPAVAGRRARRFRLFANLLALRGGRRVTTRCGRCHAGVMLRMAVVCAMVAFAGCQPARWAYAGRTLFAAWSRSVAVTRACFRGAPAGYRCPRGSIWARRKFSIACAFERVNPQADIWFGGPTTIFDRGIHDSLLAPYRPVLGPPGRPSAGIGPDDLYYPVYRTPAIIAYNSRLSTTDQGPEEIGMRCSSHAGTASAHPRSDGERDYARDLGLFLQAEHSIHR